MTFREQMAIKYKKKYDWFWEKLIKYDKKYEKHYANRNRKMNIFPLNRIKKGAKAAIEYFDGSGIFILYTFKHNPSCAPDYTMELTMVEDGYAHDVKEMAIPDEYCIEYADFVASGIKD